MLDFLLGTHEFLGNHSFPEFIVGYLFGAALIIGAPTVFLLLAFVSALTVSYTHLTLPTSDLV